MRMYALATLVMPSLRGNLLAEGRGIASIVEVCKVDAQFQVGEVQLFHNVIYCIIPIVEC